MVVTEVDYSEPMKKRTLLTLFALAAFVLAALVVAGLHAAAPQRLTDQDFWKLSSDFSEPNGFFRSDNLLSNEIGMQWVIPDLMTRSKQGRAYLGVGPEQNFGYITWLKPSIVFIIDIRRGNLDLQLMYKALFELSNDRADFVSRLFSKKRPDGLTASSTAADIFTAYERVRTDDQLYAENLKTIDEFLTKTHKLPLVPEDLDGIEYVYHNFYWYGPSINYNSSGGGFGGGSSPTYADLMMATDSKGVERGYLSTEERFGVLKDLESRNLIVPVVGNFGGPKAIRAVGQYLKDNDVAVSAFYLSNVEQYLQQDGLWNNFCRSVATLPLDEASTFIRSVRGGGFGPGYGLNSDLGKMVDDTRTCR